MLRPGTLALPPPPPRGPASRRTRWGRCCRCRDRAGAEDCRRAEQGRRWGGAEPVAGAEQSRRRGGGGYGGGQHTPAVQHSGGGRPADEAGPPAGGTVTDWRAGAGDPDPRTPVLAGVGQASERLGQPGYRRRSPVDLAADAARAALADTGADPALVAAAIGAVAGVRQFEISSPVARAPLGCSDNYPRSVATRIGATPARAVLEVVGGQAPQHLVNEFAAEIAAGRGDVVLIVGSEAISTTDFYAGAKDRPDFTEHAGGGLEDRGHGLRGLVSAHLATHGLAGMPSQYALAENARRARVRQTRADYAAAMGALFAPFTRVAAANPHAAAPTVRTAAELITPTEANRLIADPYTRYLVAREKVNQGAAVLLMSVAAADRLGVPP